MTSAPTPRPVRCRICVWEGADVEATAVAWAAGNVPYYLCPAHACDRSLKLNHHRLLADSERIPTAHTRLHRDPPPNATYNHARKEPYPMATLKQAREAAGIDTASPTISGAEKATLASAGTPFMVTHVQISDGGDFDPAYQVTVSLDGKDRYLWFGLNPFRDPDMDALAAACAVEPVGPLKLTLFRSKGGFSGYRLEDAE